MKESPEIITAAAGFIGSLVKAIKIKMNYRSAIASIILATTIGYLMPGIVDYFLPEADRQLTIAISILIGFFMHALTEAIEEFIKDKFGVEISKKIKK